MTGLNTSGRATVYQLLNAMKGRPFIARSEQGVTTVMVVAVRGRQTFVECEFLVDMHFDAFLEELEACRDRINARLGDVISIAVEEETAYVFEQEELLACEKAA